MPVVLRRARLGQSRPALVGLDRGDPINEALEFCLIANGLTFYDLGPRRLNRAGLPTSFARYPTRYGVASRVDQLWAGTSALPSALAPSGPYSLMIRCAFTAISPPGESLFWSATNGNYWSKGIMLYAKGNTTVSGRVLARIKFTNAYDTGSVSDYLVPCDDQTLSTIIGTWDGARRKLYIDGVLATDDAHTTEPDWTGFSDVRWSVGNNGGGYSTSVVWDQARLWNRALSQQEVIRLSRTEPHAGLRSGLSLFRRAAGTQYESAASDGQAVADAISALITAQASIADSQAVTDATDRISTFQRTVSDSTPVTDATDRTSVFQRSASDSAAMGDTAIASSAYVVLITDATTAADATEGGVAYISTIADAVSVGDSVISSSAYLSAVSDSVTAADAGVAAATFLATIADAVSAADATAAGAALQAAIVDALATGDVPLAALTALGAVTETVTAMDGSTVLATLRVAIADAAVLTDAALAPSATVYVVNVSLSWNAPERERVWTSSKQPRVWH